MIFSLFGGRLGVLHLHDCDGGGEEGGAVFGVDNVLEFCRGAYLEILIGKAESGGGVRSNQFIGCTYNQLRNV